MYEKCEGSGVGSTPAGQERVHSRESHAPTPAELQLQHVPSCPLSCLDRPARASPSPCNRQVYLCPHVHNRVQAQQPMDRTAFITGSVQHPSQGRSPARAGQGVSIITSTVQTGQHPAGTSGRDTHAHRGRDTKRITGPCTLGRTHSRRRRRCTAWGPRQMRTV